MWTCGCVVFLLSPNSVSLVRSPLYYVVTGLTGGSVTFAPIFLHLSGKGTFYRGYGWIIVPLCFVVIYFVPSLLFYGWYCRGKAITATLKVAHHRGS